MPVGRGKGRPPCRPVLNKDAKQMIKTLWTWLEARERALRRSFGRDISTPSARRWAWVHFHLCDHAFLRKFWTNLEEISPGVWRSNQPSPARLAHYKRMGIKTIVNLRGEDKFAHYLLEKEACENLDLTLIDAKLWARDAASKDRIIAAFEAVQKAEKPVLFHCKSGADRTGCIAAMYQIIVDGKPVEEARKQLALKYYHLDFTKTGVQDYILDVYRTRLIFGKVEFLDWLRHEYKSRIIQEGWDTRTPSIDTARALMTRPGAGQPDDRDGTKP